MTNALGRTTQYAYQDPDSPNLSAATDFRGRTLVFDWDAQGRLLSVTRPTPGGGTATRTVAYDAQTGLPTTFTNELGGVTSVSLNAQGLPGSVTGPTGTATQLEYNARGQVTRTVDPTGAESTVDYAADGRPTRWTNELNQSVSLAYDAAGRPSVLTDALNRTVSVGISPFSRLVSISGPDGSGYSVTRNAANLPTELSVAGGAVHRWTYDGAARPISGTDPAGAIEMVTRDANGNPLVLTDRRGQRTEVTYGPGDRVQQVLYRRTDGTVESTVAYTYDPGTDLLAQISDTTGPGYSFLYNSLDQVTAITGPEGTTSFGYDTLGRKISAQAPGQPAVQYGYDGYGRLLTVTQAGQTLAYGYDPANGRLASVTRPNGIVTSYGYDPLSRINWIEHRHGGTLLEYEAYTYDAGSRITARERNGVATGFSYDSRDRLTGYTLPGETASFSYDAGGNRTAQTVGGVPRSFGYGAANRLTADGGQTVTHDANGSVTQYGGDTLTWDGRGRLVRIQGSGATTEFAYDCFNRRTSKTVNGGTTRYRYLGMDLAAETDAGGTVTASYFYQPGVDLPISRTDAGGAVYYLQDLAGSVSALARPDGTLLGRYHYTPFGDVTADPGLPAQPLLWTGRERDESGFYYLRGRYYHAGSGRFLSEDPGGLQASLNLYTFAHNSPVGMRDPFGADAKTADDLPATKPWYEAAWKHWCDTVGEGQENLDEIYNQPFRDQQDNRILRDMRLENGKGSTWDQISAFIDFGVSIPGTFGGIGAVRPAGAGGGGMLGGPPIRAQDRGIADELQGLGWTIVGGGGDRKQICIRDPKVPPTGRPGRPKNSVFPDVTATKGTRTLHIQTVDVDANGQPTDREIANLGKILERRPNDEVIWIPKNR